jgi:DNA polymerase I
MTTTKQQNSTALITAKIQDKPQQNTNEEDVEARTTFAQTTEQEQEEFTNEESDQGSVETANDSVNEDGEDGEDSENDEDQAAVSNQEDDDLSTTLTGEMPLVILIDGSSYLYRAYHALPQLTTVQGQPTGAIYGVVNMVRKLLHDYHPQYVAVIFDTKGKNFRHAIYPEYKATRPPMEDALCSQIEPLHEVIKAMGLPLLTVEGVEADDVIATLARAASYEDMRVLISTGDKDLAQLVDDNIMLINTMNNEVLDSEGVQKKFGVSPEQMVDYLSLVGDKSDNVPGVPMVGPKTAVKLLSQYGSVDKIIEHAADIKGKVGHNVQQHIDTLKVARQLITVKDDVALDYEPDDLIAQKQNREKLIALFQQLEFKSWLKAVLHETEDSDADVSPNAEAHAAHRAPHQEHTKHAHATTTTTEPSGKSTHQLVAANYQTILDAEAFHHYLVELKQASSFALDLETDSLDIINAKIIGISLAINVGAAVYIPLAHDYEGAPKQLDRDKVLRQLKPLLEDPHQIKLGQNLKFDMSVLASNGIELRGIGFDTMLESYLLNSAGNRHDKETLVLQYLGKTLVTFEEVAGKGSKQQTFNQIDLATAAPYAATDADVVLQLHAVMWEKLQQQPKLIKVLQKIEIPLLSVLSRMERCGVKIDEELLKKQSAEISKKLECLAAEAYKIADSTFNLNSPQQLQEVLFEKLKLPIIHKTPTGQPSTAEPTLQELALDYPLPKVILEYRGLTKLKSTYTDALPEQINPTTGRVHTSYNQAVTATGRLSSTNPNLQNIPIRTEEGRRIRQAFIANRGHKIISADYSQIELRIMAYLSKDKGLIHAFATGQDVHRSTAAEVFGVPLDKVTDEQRQRAKTINFGLIYGMSAFGLAKRMGLSREAAQGYIESYFKHYPGVKEYMEQARHKAYEQGYVETIFGRKLYIPDIKAKNPHLRNAAERAAINAPLQGSAADMMKIAMIQIDHWICASHLDIKMIMQVHDELVFEVSEEDMARAIPKIKHYMENAVQLPGHAIPILVHVGAGDNWDEAH